MSDPGPKQSATSGLSRSRAGIMSLTSTFTVIGCPDGPGERRQSPQTMTSSPREVRGGEVRTALIACVPGRILKPISRHAHSRTKEWSGSDTQEIRDLSRLKSLRNAATGKGPVSAMHREGPCFAHGSAGYVGAAPHMLGCNFPTPTIGSGR